MAVSSISSTSNYYTQAAAAGPVSIATALAAIKANSRNKVTISDTTQNIANNLEALRSVANNINAVAQTDASTVIDVTASQWSRLSVLLGKFSSDYQLRVSGVSTANLASTASNLHVSSFSVSDTSSNIAAQLGSGLNGQAKLSSITITNPGTLVNVTAAQVGSLSAVIGKLTGNYGLAVSGASASEAVGYTSNLHIKSVAVRDTVANVSAQLDNLRGLGLRLKEVRGSDSNTFTVNADQLQTDALVIGKIYQGYQLSVLGASMNQAKSLVSNSKVVSVDIVDTAANVSANLDLLRRLDTDLNSIHVTDTAHALTMSSTDYGSYTGVLGKILGTDNYTVAIKGASISEAQTLAGDTHVSAIAVSDSSLAIGTDLHALQLNTDLMGKLTGISQKGKATALNVSYGQLSTDAAVLGKFTDSYSLNVSNVSAANALTLAASNSRVASLSVNDTGANVTAQLDNLAALGKRLSQINVSDTTTALNLSVSRWSSQIGTLSKISGGYSLALSGVSADRALGLMSDSRVRSVAVSDSANAISAQLDKLHSLGSQLTGITQTDAANIAVTADQWTNQSSTLAKLGSGYTLSVRNALATQLGALTADGKVKAIAIADSSDNIASQLDALQSAITASNAPSISVRQTGTASPMAITASQLSNDAAALAVIGGNYSLAVSGVSAANASTVGANGKVASMTVSDTGTNLVSNLSDLARLGTKVSSLSQSDASTNRLALTATQWASYSNVLGKISTSVRANVSQVKASGASSLLSDARVASVSVTDSGSQISAQLDRLQGLGTLLSSIQQSDATNITLTMDQMRNAASTIAKISGSYNLAVQGATASEAQDMLDSTYSHVVGISVSDTSANIAAHLDDLQANVKLTRIVQTGTASELSLNKAQLTSDAAALAKIQGSYHVAIQDAAVGDVSTLAANGHVSSMVVTGTASDIVSKLPELQLASSKVSSLRLSVAPSTLAMSQDQWITYQPVLAKISQNYSASVSSVGASQASGIAGDPRVATVSVSDSSSRINANLDNLQALGAKLQSIAVTDSGTPPAMALSATQYFANASALAKITGGNYSLNVSAASVVDVPTLVADSKVALFAVADTSDNIAASLSTLNGLSGLTTVSQTETPSPMTLSADVFNASAATLAKITNNYQLNIEDAAMTSAADLQANTHVLGFNLKTTTATVDANLSDLVSMSKLGSVALTADDGPIHVTRAELSNWSSTLDALQGAYQLSVSDVGMTDLPEVSANPNVTRLALTASSQEVSGEFDALIALGTKLEAFTLNTPTTPVALTYKQWNQGTGTLSKLTQTDYKLAVVDARVTDVSNILADDHVATVSLSDTAENVMAEFDSLTALGNQLDAIELDEAHPTLQLTQAQYDAGMATGGLLRKIMGTWDHTITA